MTSIRDTDDLIRSLASDPRGTRRLPSARTTLAVAAAAGFLAASALTLVCLATPAGLDDAVRHRWLWQKLISMGALAAGAWPILRDLARPERASPRVAALAPALLLLLAGAALDRGGVELAGRSATSVPSCVADVVLLSLPGLALILAALRATAAPARPAWAGMAAGLLAGCLGAAAYAFACRNDGGLFILVWYGAALGIVTGLGGAAGRIVLAW